MVAGGHFEKKMNVAFGSEMARNANENEFRISKMVASGHFEKKMKVAFWSEMARNATENELNQGHWVFYGVYLINSACYN